jgi:hypothetical protein
MGAWLGAQLAKLPRGPAPADIDTLTLTTAHAASSYGRPVAVIEGAAYGPEDMTPAGVTGAELVTTWAAHFLAPLTPQHETAFDGLHAIMAKLRRLSPDERVSVLNAFDNILGAILWRAPAES